MLSTESTVVNEVGVFCFLELWWELEEVVVVKDLLSLMVEKS